MSQSAEVVGVRVDATSCEDAASRVVQWARTGESRYVCVAAVNNVMQAHDHPAFRTVMSGADLVVPDGMPLVWSLRALGISGAQRVCGRELMRSILDLAEEEEVSVGFYGGRPEVLRELNRRVARRWPRLRVSYSYSCPFRLLTDQEDEEVVRAINGSGTRILFVGLGCPKQESWMADRVSRVDAVMIGVGAAFDFLAGAQREPPVAMQKAGMEWLFRLCSEPRRLWKRYLGQNPRFAVLSVKQVAAHVRHRRALAAARHAEN